MYYTLICVGEGGMAFHAKRGTIKTFISFIPSILKKLFFAKQAIDT